MLGQIFPYWRDFGEGYHEHGQFPIELRIPLRSTFRVLYSRSTCELYDLLLSISILCT